ncbi:MAG TPA: glycosyltransferase family 4 protein [Solirubrobacteraceae bacterium]|nr:glycosyltransferase family 4 protein [Solirubrobacteraceae bacterium]
MDVQVVDPSSYTPPYDHALCSALSRAGARVELVCSRFAYGTVPEPRGYVRSELFYRHAVGLAAGRLRSASKLAEHVPDMLRYRRHARTADVVHFQWLPVQALDRWLLPSHRQAGSRAGGALARGGGTAAPALVLTSHDILPREPRRGQLAAQRRLYDRFDAIVVHSHRGRERLVAELGVPADRVHVIAHGVFDHLAERSPGALPPQPPHDTDRPVVLMLGLLRPYKGLDVLLEAWRGADGGGPIENAELWIAGLPRMNVDTLRATAPANVRFDARFIDQHELPGYFERADLVVLPYLQADQSGVLFTALAFGKPLLLSDVGGFPELAADTGAALVVPAGDAAALARALRELLGNRAALAEMCVKARAAATGHYSWEAVAASHLALYQELLG